MPPEYRHVNIEALRELGEIFKVNPDLYFEDYISLDVLIGHAVRLGWLDQQPERVKAYEDDKAAAWHASFYKLPPNSCARYISMASGIPHHTGRIRRKRNGRGRRLLNTNRSCRPEAPRSSLTCPQIADWSD